MKRCKTPKKRFFRQDIACLGASLLLSVVILLPPKVVAGELQDCMSKTLHSANPDMTIAQLQLQCEKAIEDGSYFAAKDDS
jgi:hypothetical protein